MEMTTEKTGDNLIIFPEGRIDSQNAQSFQDRISSYINDGERSIILDFSGIEYISSACLRALLYLTKQMKKNNGRIALCSLKQSVNKILKVSGFDSILEIFKDRDSAIQDN